MEMDLIVLMFRFFPVFAIATNFLNFLLVRKKMSSVTKKFLIYSTVYFLMWGLLQLLGGYGTFMFVFLPPWEHPLAAVFWVLHIAGVWGFAAWMIRGIEAEQALENEVIEGDDGVKKKREEMLRLAVTGSLFPVLVFMGHVTGVIEQMELETLFEGLNIPWP